MMYYLDNLYQQMLEDPERILYVFDELVSRLSETRMDTDRIAWFDRVCKRAQQHCIADIVYQDPFTLRCFQKPRGYPGDAVMIDYVYDQIPPERTSDIGTRIFQHIVGTLPLPRAVRHRRELIAEKIRGAADRYGYEASILSVGCGHLREYDLIGDETKEDISLFVALDQDSQSVAHVEKRYDHTSVRPVQGTIRAILRKRYASELRFHLIYAAGLYDYLTDGIAQSLTECLFDLLINDGGTLIIPNVLPNIHDAGYMEAFMDWRLIHRSQGQMLSFCDRLPQSQVASVNTHIDPFNQIVYLEVTRA
jgi:hypothetical protein